MKFPKRPQQHVTDDQAMAAVALAVTERGWAFRPLSMTDYGIDGEIEIRDTDEQMTGALLRVQVKGLYAESTIRRKSISVNASTVRYWLVSPVPVFMLIVTLLESGNQIDVISVEDYLIDQGQSQSIRASEKPRFTFKLKHAKPFAEAFEYMEERAAEHQSALLDLRQYSLYNPAAQILGYYQLIFHYECDINLMLKHMREEATDDRLTYDYGAAAQMKKEMDENPEIIEDYKWLVNETLKDTGALDVTEKPEYVRHLFP